MIKRLINLRMVTIIFFVFLIIPVWAGRNIVNSYGQLRVNGNRICDASGNPVQLKGVSSHGLQWFPFAGDQTVKNLVDLLAIDVLRAAMYVKEWDAAYGHYAGYLGVHSSVKNTLIQVVKDSIDEGIYVIVDWHIHWNPYDSNNLHWTSDPYTNDAVNFFTEMANTTYNGKKFKDYPNVIWEIMNEPGSQISWQQVKTHANTVITAIRNTVNDTDNLIFVPATNWSQALDTIAYDGSGDRPDRQFSNIAYTLHFYAASHGSDIRSKAQTALDNNLAVFATEWGTGDYTGNGSPNESASNEWVTWMANNKVGWTTWNLSDKNETTALLDPGVGLSGPWSESQLSVSGTWVDAWIGGGSTGGGSTGGSGTGSSSSDPVLITNVYTDTLVDLSRGYAWVRFGNVPSGWVLNNSGTAFSIRAENQNASSSETVSNSWYHQLAQQGIKNQQLVKIVLLSGSASNSVRVSYW